MKKSRLNPVNLKGEAKYEWLSSKGYTALQVALAKLGDNDLQLLNLEELVHLKIYYMGEAWARIEKRLEFSHGLK